MQVAEANQLLLHCSRHAGAGARRRWFWRVYHHRAVAGHHIAVGIHALGISVIVLLLNAVLIIGAAAHTKSGAGNSATTGANGGAAPTTNGRAEPGAQYSTDGSRTDRTVVGILRLTGDLALSKLFAARLIVGELVK